MEKQMDLSNVKEVVETHRQADVNKHLECGWTILATAPGNWPEGNEPYIKYSLGWTKDCDPVFPKETYG